MHPARSRQMRLFYRLMMYKLSRSADIQDGMIKNRAVDFSLTRSPNHNYLRLHEGNPAVVTEHGASFFSRSGCKKRRTRRRFLLQKFNYASSS